MNDTTIARTFKPLSADERALLNSLEREIVERLQSFIEAGALFVRIKEKKLYREQGSFDDYCRIKYGISANYVNRVILASTLCRNLQQQGFDRLPTSEGQARLLLRSVDPVKTWERALASVPEEDVQPTDKALIAANIEISEETGVTMRSPRGNKPVVRDKESEKKNEKAAEEYEKMSRAEKAIANSYIIKTLQVQIEDWVKDLEKVDGSLPGLECLARRVPSIKLHVKNAIQLVRTSIPQKECPKCQGKGCAECSGQGWV